MHALVIRISDKHLTSHMVVGAELSRQKIKLYKSYLSSMPFKLLLLVISGVLKHVVSIMEKF